MALLSVLLSALQAKQKVQVSFSWDRLATSFWSSHTASWPREKRCKQMSKQCPRYYYCLCSPWAPHCQREFCNDALVSALISNITTTCLERNPFIFHCRASSAKENHRGGRVGWTKSISQGATFTWRVRVTLPTHERGHPGRERKHCKREMAPYRSFPSGIGQSGLKKCNVSHGVPSRLFLS